MKEVFSSNEGLAPCCPKYMFVLGAGLHSSKISETGLKLSWESRMRLAAAAELFEKFKNIDALPEIVLTGGNIYENQPQLSWIGKQKLVRSHHISRENIITTEGRNTLEEFEIIESFMNQEGLSPSEIAVISNDYHLVAKHLAQKRGICFFSAEDVLIKRHPNYQKIIQDVTTSKYYQKLLRSQRLYVKVLNIPQGERFYKAGAEKRLQGIELTPFDSNGLKKLFGTEKIE